MARRHGRNRPTRQVSRPGEFSPAFPETNAGSLLESYLCSGAVPDRSDAVAFGRGTGRRVVPNRSWRHLVSRCFVRKDRVRVDFFFELRTRHEIPITLPGVFDHRPVAPGKCPRRALFASRIELSLLSWNGHPSALITQIARTGLAFDCRCLMPRFAYLRSMCTPPRGFP